MRYRALSAAGDYQFGRSGIFLKDSAAAVAQAILTRLNLWAGEWFLDTKEGTPYEAQILGHNTQATRDLAIQQRILGTVGVTELTSYSSSVAGRRLSVSATVQTQYGTTTLTTVL